jgi:TolA-binding protein
LFPPLEDISKKAGRKKEKNGYSRAMNFRFYKLSVLLLLLAPALFAQAPRSTRQIEAALEDELYPLAEQQIWEALSIERTPDGEAALTLLLIRALAGQQKFDDAVILADESAGLPKQDAFIYWRARAFFEAGNFNAAFQGLESLPQDSTYTPAALRLKGRAELASGDFKAAQKTFETFREQFPSDENAAQNLLDLVRIYLEHNKQSDSIKALHELVERFPDSTLADTARLELARLLIASGDNDNLTEAPALLITLGSSETAHARLRSAAWVELSALEQRAGNSAAAADALAKAEKLTGEAALRVRQKAARAGLLTDEKKTKEAFALFDEAVKETTDTATAAEILLQKAEALLKTKQIADAEKAFQACLDITVDPAVQARAQAGKGWSLWEQKRYEESAVAFETSALRCTIPDRCVTALIKAGDARLAAAQYEKARENYQRVTSGYPEHPLAAQAMYQCGVASLLAGQSDAARAFFEKTEKDFPQSGFAPQAALQQAELLKHGQKWDAAQKQYRRVAAQYTNAAIRASALHQQGLILYRLGKWDAALENFRSVSTNWPDAPEAPQAYYMRGFCRYMQGDTEGALELCQSFIEKYPDSVWTPEVLFWLGEHYYNHGMYAQAKATFLDIATRFPAHEMSDAALFWAGSALLKQDSFLEAFTAFSRLAKEYPDSPLMLKTRFAQGETLTELGEFPRAILAYEEVIKSAPDDPLADRARGRRADCLFTLGTSESARYQEALEAYQALYKRPAVPFALRLQALYKIARCEAKLGLKEKAFARYMEVVYSGAGQTEPLSPEAAPWFTRAAFDAAAYQEQQQQWQEAANIYKRIIQADVPAKNEAQKRIEKIEREHASAF